MVAACPESLSPDRASRAARGWQACLRRAAKRPRAAHYFPPLASEGLRGMQCDPSGWQSSLREKLKRYGPEAKSIELISNVLFAGAAHSLRRLLLLLHPQTRMGASLDFKAADKQVKVREQNRVCSSLNGATSEPASQPASSPCATAPQSLDLRR